MANKLSQLISDYLAWQDKRKKIAKKLAGFQKEIIVLAKKEKVKKIKLGLVAVHLISQSETRFPQLDKPSRKEVEKIVRQSGELAKVMVFDIIALGNAYDEKRLSKKLMIQLKPFAKRETTTKIMVKQNRRV